MHFEITASLQAGSRQISTAQRKSSLFSEAPRIGAKTLRRGQVLKLSEAEFKASEVAIKRLYDAHAVEVCRVDGDHREDFRKREQDWKASQASRNIPKIAPKKEEVPPPPSAPKAPPAVLVPPPPPEPVKNEAFPTEEELKAAVAMENKETEAQIEKVVEKLGPVDEVPPPPPSVPAASESSEKKSKKGKR